jgi:hypothetical protein
MSHDRPSHIYLSPPSRRPFHPEFSIGFENSGIVAEYSINCSFAENRIYQEPGILAHPPPFLGALGHSGNFIGLSRLIKPRRDEACCCALNIGKATTL